MFKEERVCDSCGRYGITHDGKVCRFCHLYIIWKKGLDRTEEVINV